MNGDRQRSVSPPQSPGVHWVPDEQAYACFLCHADFSQVRRKHHCRSCGRVACNECSLKRARLQGYVEKQRVCDECDHRLREDATLAIADEIRVEKEMSTRLKMDLKAKSQQIEKFKTFLLSLDARGELAGGGNDFDGLLRLGEEEMKTLSQEVDEERERRKRVEIELTELKGKYNSRQQDAQKLAARVLRAESNLVEISKEKEERDELEREMREKNRVIEGLHERLRAAEAESSHVMLPAPLSPHGVIEEVIASGRNEPSHRSGRCDNRCQNVCTVM